MGRLSGADKEKSANFQIDKHPGWMLA